jgi:hypothetical protein
MDDVDFDDDHYWDQDDEDQDAYSDEDEDDDVCGKQIRCLFEGKEYVRRVDAKDDLNGWLMQAIKSYKKDWVYFGNNWEVRASDIPALMQKCSKLFEGVRDEWKITVATDQTQIAQCRRELRIRQKAAEAAQEEEDGGEVEVLPWNLISPDMDLGSCIAPVRGDVELGWRIFGEGWEVESSHAEEMAKTCRFLFRHVPRKKWEITICKSPMQAYEYRRDHNVKEPPTEESREKDQSRGSCASVSGPSCKDTLAAGPDCTSTQLGQLSAQDELGSRVGGSSPVGSSAVSGGTSDGKITNDPKQAEAGLDKDAVSSQQLGIDSVKHQGLVNQPRLTSYHDTRGVDEPNREISVPVLGVELRSNSLGWPTENAGLKEIRGESEPIHDTGSSGDSKMGEADATHDRDRRAEECSAGHTTDDTGERVNPEIISHGGSPRVDDPD